MCLYPEIKPLARGTINIYARLWCTHECVGQSCNARTTVIAQMKPAIEGDRGGTRRGTGESGLQGNVGTGFNVLHTARPCRIGDSVNVPVDGNPVQASGSQCCLCRGEGYRLHRGMHLGHRIRIKMLHRRSCSQVPAQQVCFHTMGIEVSVSKPELPANISDRGTKIWRIDNQLTAVQVSIENHCT